MAVTESKIEERLMRMGNEARYMKATDKVLDMNKLRKLAVKQLTKEDEQHKQEQAKTYQAWINKIQSCPKLEHHYIMVFRNNIPTVEQYAGKLVLAAIKQYQFRHIYGNIPAFTA